MKSIKQWIDKRDFLSMWRSIFYICCCAIVKLKLEPGKITDICHTTLLIRFGWKLPHFDSNLTGVKLFRRVLTDSKLVLGQAIEDVGKMLFSEWMMPWLLDAYMCLWASLLVISGGSFYSSLPYILRLENFGILQKVPIDPLHHFHISQVSPQINCEIWMWYSIGNNFFYNSDH